MEQVDFRLGCGGGCAEIIGFAVLIVAINLASLGLIACDHIESQRERRDRVR